MFPSVTYPSHTTLVTGARPANHGILFNRDPEDGWDFFFEKITAPTVAYLLGLTLVAPDGTALRGLVE